MLRRASRFSSRPPDNAFAYLQAQRYEQHGRAVRRRFDHRRRVTRAHPADSLADTARHLQRARLGRPMARQLAVALATGYDLDIFTVGRDGSNPTNLTHQGSYDFWPVWSPDGTYLAFVSDRARCPSWIPGEPEPATARIQPPPDGGNVYVLEIATGQVRQLSDQWVTEPPRWANPRTVVYSSGDPLLGDQRTRPVDDASHQRRNAQGHAQQRRCAAQARRVMVAGRSGSRLPGGRHDHRHRAGAA